VVLGLKTGLSASVSLGVVAAASDNP
jgi:hypothetical protein